MVSQHFSESRLGTPFHEVLLEVAQRLARQELRARDSFVIYDPRVCALPTGRRWPMFWRGSRFVSLATVSRGRQTAKQAAAPSGLLL